MNGLVLNIVNFKIYIFFHFFFTWSLCYFLMTKELLMENFLIPAYVECNLSPNWFPTEKYCPLFVL